MHLFQGNKARKKCLNEENREHRNQYFNFGEKGTEQFISGKQVNRYPREDLLRVYASCTFVC